MRITFSCEELKSALLKWAEEKGFRIQSISHDIDGIHATIIPYDMPGSESEEKEII